ncbi:MAG TPA: YsnF/AvaK domain-containing protein [Blastocatellia bacterium]|nr:YsnF/AvaK domain-containing protein [Blastocatellia bacterium]
MNRRVVGVFDTYDEAEAVVRELESEGFRREQINIISNEAGNNYSDDTRQSEGRSFGEKVSNFFGSLFGDDVDDDERGYYSEAVRRGGAMVAVDTDDDRAERVITIMESHDAVDIDRRADYYRETGYSGYDAGATPYTSEEATRERDQYRSRQSNEGEINIPVIEEDIEVDKRQVRRGGVRVYNRVTETPVQEDVTLREEHVSVDRRPVNRPVSEADMDNLREGVIEVTETGEEAVVAKRARVAEEVVINKEVGERTETVRDTVRRSDVEVEDLKDTTDTASKQARNRR